MTTKLTQATVSRLTEDHPAGTQIYDIEAKGLRLVVGKRGVSYKHVGRINDGTEQYVSVMIGRTDEVSWRSARERSAELRLTLRRGEDPRRKKATVPNLNEAMDRYLKSRPDLSERTVSWHKQSSWARSARCPRIGLTEKPFGRCTSASPRNPAPTMPTARCVS